MEYRLEALLDRCLFELKQGRDLEDILGDHPDAADELRPLLATAAWAALHVPPHRHTQEHKRAVMARAEDRRRVVESVDGYVNEVRAGVDYEEIVRRAPEGLAWIVLAAWRMKTTAVPRPDAARVAQNKTRLIALAAERRRAIRAQVTLAAQLRGGLADLAHGFVAHGLLPRPTVARRMRSATASAVATVILAAGVLGMNTAAADSVPGQPFYGVKRISEAAQLLLTADESARAALIIEFSERRLAEMRLLADQGSAVPPELAAEWLDGHSRAWDQIQRLPWDQRELLTEMLLASLESPQARVVLPAGRGELAASLRHSLGIDQPVTVEEVSSHGQPLLRSDVLPAEETAHPSGADTEAGVAEPAPAADVGPAAPHPEPPMVVAPPVVSVPPTIGDDDDEPAAPPVEDPAAEPSPRGPAFGVPPVAPSPEDPPEGDVPNP